MNTDKIQSLSISADLWSNIHSFSQLSHGSEPRDLAWLDQHFPEIFRFKQALINDEILKK
jgi:hypothetical protein